jgi:HAD superfamily hydrolase (TIGR01450 family)
LKTLSALDLIESYDAVLLDAYGVLVDATGVLPHAVAFIEALRARQKPFYIVTNDASRLEENIEARFARLGLAIEAAQIVTSAGLLTKHFAQNDLQGAPTLVLGSEDAHTYVRRAGGQVLTPGSGAASQARAVVICEATGPRTVSDVECVIDTVVARREGQRPIDLILCNPDLIYPKSPGRYGLTSGALMALVEGSLKTRLHPSLLPPIARLGKPFPEIFAEAARRAGGGKLALVGDQLGTDILGAKNAGMDAVLVGTGLTQVRPGETLEPAPHFLLPNLAL